MPQHTNVFGALAGVDPSGLPGTPVDGELTCEGAKFHSPSPLLVSEVALPDGRTVHLCGTCRDNLAVLRYLMSDQNTLPWEIRREFGNRLRALVSMPGGTDG